MEKELRGKVFKVDVSLDRIREDSTKIKVLPNDRSDFLAYTSFLNFFKQIDKISVDEFIISANFTYAWMPTCLTLKKLDDITINNAVEILNRVKNRQEITNEDFLTLKGVINNSLVGTSKLLHFINPEQYGIWDSKVYKYIFNKLNNDRLNNPEMFRSYLDECRSLIQDNEFSAIHKDVEEKVGYSITKFRALELVMFLSS